MATYLELNIWSLKNKLLKNIVNIVIDVTSDVFSDVKKFSPIDTGKYVKSHRFLGVRIEWNKVIWAIANNMEYSEKVEFGWRKKPVNWHLRNLSSVYNSVWADVYKKAIENNKINFKNRLW